MPSIEEVEKYRFGFDDIVEGMELEGPSRTITEADVCAFAGLSGDYNLLHTSTTFAERTRYKRRIVHGMLVASIISGLSTRLVFNAMSQDAIIGALEVNARFPAPTFIGDTIQLRIKVKSTRPTSDGKRGIVEYERYGVKSDGTIVCVCAVKVLMRRL